MPFSLQMSPGNTITERKEGGVHNDNKSKNERPWARTLHDSNTMIHIGRVKPQVSAGTISRMTRDGRKL